MCVTLTHPADTPLKLLHAGARSKQKTAAALTPSQQPGEEAALIRCPYPVFFGTPVTNKLPLKWVKMSNAPLTMRLVQATTLHETQEAFLNC